MIDADGWVKIITAVFAGLGTLGTVIIGILQISQGRKINRNATEATVARAGIKKQVDKLEVNTNSITTQLGISKLAQGTAEGHAAGLAEGKASVPAASGGTLPTGQIEGTIKGTIETKSP